ncbi:lipid-binding SYLF domain-containing protein [Pseudothermotoga sp.]|nr:lipid-binding SYLF domain-containing protein [Pseudothermotoga sp.]MCX7812612.1 lipid-binding SYLF domain-containing protein [Pseudothermotoga sp.]MDW8138891.1 lipid-binding SYLF domain-containing protein [Pseudothermotoga sp.]
MKRVVIFLICVPLFVFAVSANERLNSALSIMKELSNVPDSGAFVELLRQSEGLAIFPSLIRIGLVIGGQYGEGFLLKRDVARGKWYGPVFLKLTGLSLGAQLGIQNVGLVLVLMNEQAVKSLLSASVTLGGNVSIAAGPLGRSLSAETDYKLQASIYSYSVSKGFFAGLSLQGSMVQLDNDANKEYYGTLLTTEEMMKREPSTREAVELIKFLNSLIYLQPGD